MYRDGTHLVTASTDKQVKLVDAQTLEVLKVFNTDRPANAAALSPIFDQARVHTCASHRGFATVLQEELHRPVNPLPNTWETGSRLELHWIVLQQQGAEAQCLAAVWGMQEQKVWLPILAALVAASNILRRTVGCRIQVIVTAVGMCRCWWAAGRMPRM